MTCAILTLNCLLTVSLDETDSIFLHTNGLQSEQGLVATLGAARGKMKVEKFKIREKIMIYRRNSRRHLAACAVAGVTSLSDS